MAQDLAVAYTLVDLKMMADDAIKSGLFPSIRNAHTAVTLMMLCQSEGIHPIRALQTYHIMENGQPTMRADAMQAKFIQKGGIVRWVQSDDEVCIARFIHPTYAPEPGFTVRLAMADVIARDLFKRNYKQYPGAMLRARVISAGVRAVYPGLIMGIYTPEEMEANQTAGSRVGAVSVESYAEGQGVQGADVPSSQVTHSPQATLPAIGQPASDQSTIDVSFVEVAPRVETPRVETKPTPTPTPEPTPEGPPKVTASQLGEIYDLFALVGFTSTQVADILSRRGVTSANDLTSIQATEILAKCREIYAKKSKKVGSGEVAQVSVATPVVAPVTAPIPVSVSASVAIPVAPVAIDPPIVPHITPPIASSPIPEPTPKVTPEITPTPEKTEPEDTYYATQRQVDEIDSLIPRFPKRDGSKGYTREEVGKFLALRINAKTGKSCTTVEDLSREQAAEIIANFRKYIPRDEMDELADRFAGVKTPQEEAARLAGEFQAKPLGNGASTTPPLQEALTEVFTHTQVRTHAHPSSLGNHSPITTHPNGSPNVDVVVADPMDNIILESVQRPEKIEPVKAPKREPIGFDPKTGKPIYAGSGVAAAGV